MPLCGSVTHIYFFYSWFHRLSIAPKNTMMRQIICTPRLAYSRATIYLGMVGCVFFPHLRTWSRVSLRTAFLPGHSLGVVTTQVQMHRSPPKHVSSDSCTSGHITSFSSVLSRCLLLPALWPLLQHINSLVVSVTPSWKTMEAGKMPIVCETM